MIRFPVVGFSLSAPAGQLFSRVAGVAVYQISRELVRGNVPWSVGLLAGAGRGLRTSQAAGRCPAPSEPPRPHRTIPVVGASPADAVQTT